MSDAFRLWAESYDEAPNALLRLGDRALAAALGELTGLRALDAGCGTCRWMRSGSGAGAHVAGFDRERAMLAKGPSGSVVEAAFGSAPFLSEAFDLVTAAFSLSYSDNPAACLADLCRLVKGHGRIAVADLHPDAAEARWRRTFRAGERTVEIASDVPALEAALIEPPEGWRVETLDSYRFGEPERNLFTEEHWEQARRVWAVRLAIWRRSG